MLARATMRRRRGCVPGQEFSDYNHDVEPFRRFVSRKCTVCEWDGQAVERADHKAECPWCHAPTEIVREELLVPIEPGKNPLASALSRLGAARGGRARAERLSASRRREIARAAANARWRGRN
jgi:hypothetical protein